MSMSGASSRWAASRPTVLFPDPGSPTSTRWRRTSASRSRLAPLPDPARSERLEVSGVIAAHLAEGVAAELLEHGVRQHQGHHRFRDHAERGNGGDLGAFAFWLAWPARGLNDRW